MARKNPKKAKAPDLSVENNLRRLGFKKIAGLDEAGRGAWAGPLIAAAVILKDKRLYLIRDSKILTRQKRLYLERKIRKQALAAGIGAVYVSEINQRGIGWASHEVMRRALTNLKSRSGRKIKPDYILIDHIKLKNSNFPQASITKGDQKSLSIAASSILAKCERDRLMIKLHKENLLVKPFKFQQNFGYGTAHHKKTLKKLGPTPFHRKWRPILDLKKLRLEF